jgi:hypothetical protein
MLSLALHVQEEPVLWVSEGEMLTRISGPNTKEVTRRRMREGHLSYMREGREMRNTYEP